MQTPPERTLSAYMFERYCAALAEPGPRTRDALSCGLQIAHAHVRQGLEDSFDATCFDPRTRHRMLRAHRELDAALDQFRSAVTSEDPDWVARGHDFIRFIESVHALVCLLRARHVGPAASRGEQSEPGAPDALLEDQDTQVWRPVREPAVVTGDTAVAAAG